MALPNPNIDEIQEWLQNAAGIDDDRQLALFAISMVTGTVAQNTVMIMEALSMVKGLLGMEEEE